MKRPQIDHRVGCHPVGFLVVSREMLKGCADAFFLHSLNITCGESSREKRILGKIFEITPAQRRALDIYAGAENHGYPEIFCLGGDAPGHLSDQFPVPRTSHGTRRRKACCLVTVIILGTVLLRAYAVRPVRNLDITYMPCAKACYNSVFILH